MKWRNEQKYPHESRPKAQPPDGVTSLPKAVDNNTVPGQLAHNLVKSYILERGLDWDTAEFNGWYPSRSAGDTELRVVMPAVNTKGYAYWQARAVVDTVKKRYMSPDYASTDSVILVWPKGNKMRNTVVIVEGPMDALAAAEFGYPGVALMGKGPQPEAIDHVCKILTGKRALVIPDSDSFLAGCRLVMELARKGCQATLRLPQVYKDLAAMPKEMRETFLDG